MVPCVVQLAWSMILCVVQCPVLHSVFSGTRLCILQYNILCRPIFVWILILCIFLYDIMCRLVLYYELSLSVVLYDIMCCPICYPVLSSMIICIANYDIMCCTVYDIMCCPVLVWSMILCVKYLVRWCSSKASLGNLWNPTIRDELMRFRVRNSSPTTLYRDFA